MIKSKRQMFLSLKQAEPIKERPASVQEALEIQKVAPNGIFQVGENRYSKSYLIRDTNYDTNTYDEQVGFFDAWCKNLNSMDVNFKITIFNGNRNQELVRKEILYEMEGDPYDACRVCYNDIIEDKLMESRQGIEQKKYLTVVTQRNSYGQAKNHLNSVEQNLVGQFSSLGSELVPLSGTERLDVLFHFWNMGEEEKFDPDLLEECIYHGRDWRNDLACGSIDFSGRNDRFRIGGRTGKCFYIVPNEYPNTLSDSFLKKLSEIPAKSLYSLDYIPIPRDIALRTLELAYQGIESQISKQQKKRNEAHEFSSDVSYLVRRQKEEIEEMLDDIRQNDQKMFWVAVTILLAADNDGQMETAEIALKQICDENSLKVSEYRNLQREALNTVLPIGVRQVNQMRSMFTQTAGALIPFNVQEIQIYDKQYRPFYYGINAISRNPILANRKLLMNGNGFVFGVPGSGKSFTGSKMEMGSVFLTTKDTILVIDPTHEYKDVADAFGGTFIELSIESRNYINPMEVDLKNLLETDSNHLIKGKVQLLQGIVEQCMKGEFRQVHASLVDRCVGRLYKSIARLPAGERKQPLMEDFYNILKGQEDPEARTIYLSLETFIEGSLNLFNHQTNVDTSNRIVVFGMRDLGEELSKIGMLIMLDYIERKVLENFKKSRATWLYVDEFHILLLKEFSKQYFIRIWATVRKQGCLCTGLTQNVSRVLNDVETASLIINSEYTMFLKQEGPDAKLICQYFESISPALMKYVTKAQPGTGLVRFGNEAVPMNNQIEKTNPIYDIYNTNMHEKAAQKKAREKMGRY